MKIYGLQKLSLLDYPDHLACTLFTGGCPFCCPFCHNKDLVNLDAHLQQINQDEILDYLHHRKGILEAVCITGGEPLMNKDCIDLIKKIKDLGYKVKIDTNGYYPKRLKELIDQGLIDYIAMDIKNSPKKYAITCGLKSINLSLINKSIELLKTSSIPYEFRTTIVEEYHNLEDMSDIADWIAGNHPYYLQQFVNRDSVICPNLHSKTKEEMENFKKLLYSKIPNTKLRGIE